MSNNIFKNLLIVGGGGAIAQLFNVLSTPLITRLYSPSSYGEWAYIIAMVALFSDVSVLRYELAVVLPKTNIAAANIVGLSVILAIVSTSMMCIVMVLWGDLLFGELVQWLWLLPPLVIMPGIYQTLLSWCTRTKDFFVLSVAGILLVLVTIIVQLGGVWYSTQSSMGLIWGTLIGQLVALGFIGIIVVCKNKSLFSEISLKGMQSVFVQFKNYPLYMVPYTLISVFKNRTVIYILNYAGDIVNIGYYAFSDRLIRLPGNFISGAIRPVFFQQASVSGLKAIEALLVRALFLINRFSTPLLVFFIFEASDIFLLIFGKDWQAASFYAIVLSFPAYFSIHINWLDRGMDVLGCQKLVFQLEMTFSVLSLLGLVFGAFFLENIDYGIMLQAGILCFYQGFWLICFFKNARFDFRKLLNLCLSCSVLVVTCTCFLFFGKRMLPIMWAEGIYLMVYAYACLRILPNDWGKLKSEVTNLPLDDYK